MSKENFEKQIRKRMEQLDEINEHGIFKELKGTVTDFNYDTKSLTMTFEATKFHENAFGIMFGGSLAGMFDIAFGTLTAGLGDYSVAPTVQLSTTFLKVPLSLSVKAVTAICVPSLKPISAASNAIYIIQYLDNSSNHEIPRWKIFLFNTCTKEAITMIINVPIKTPFSIF